MIFHITERSRWERSLAEGWHTASTRGVELADEGFIHCSTAAQWPRVLRAFYGGEADVVLLHIDETRLSAPLVVERLDGAAEAFPHIYGPLDVDAVVEVEPLTVST